ncbi:MAG: ATP-binding cassette domain-containing protein [Acidobacteria bacterium]|uniref:ATP-binding cassette domain-containing protein n=1 Tax=Candidatus Polarisedimenticola svalbardensis TaxID=2886004 RepID=A0A8J6Y7D0_9BACT|nr:ATP-binding cassette domain-containing protein [Candidatus Polarisedimenticola svalbardensis]
MIEVKGLARRYGSTWALVDLSFTVGEGEVVGFLGPNGAGKSTAMKILTCSLAPTAGTASVAGFDVQKDAINVRRHIGFMPEHVALYTDQPVLAYLKFVAELKGVPRGEVADHVADIVQQTGLTEVCHKHVGNLSHGFRKRVGLAQALISDPKVLFLDEPTSGLDPHQIVEIRHLIKSFRGHRTVLLSSHILSEVSAICERVLILDKGRLVGEESADGLIKSDPAAGQGTQTVLLSWDGDRDAVVEALMRVAGVDEVVVTGDGAEVIIAGNPVEVRPKLVESVIQAGGQLQNIQDKGPSLEDLFLRLTGADRGPENDSGRDA